MDLRRPPIAAVLVALAVLPAGAVAKPAARAPALSVRGQATVARATAVAQRFWGAVPCGGAVTVLVRQTVPAGLERDSDAWVTFGTALGDNDLSAPPAGFTRCTIALGRDRWPTAASLVTDWDMLCMTVVHEMGHLLGHAHDSAPGSVMAPVFADYSAEPQSCRTSRPGPGRGV